MYEHFKGAFLRIQKKLVGQEHFFFPCPRITRQIVVCFDTFETKVTKNVPYLNIFKKFVHHQLIDMSCQFE
ncbi:hypothetical protein BpHYR1_037280 [Brachionus plicatilis]|uniref:Uncharacterized protein n=1 Tax=Brachionus plicatilis TaxID=10195 RepID=A0A3M7QKU4_BRAPC|nr:hypothetical protein BpHYR1_037280 [Brachionus plicatilis]